MGHFEHGLIFFHRGHALRPELDQFRLGIQKCQEAIENSVGSPAAIQLDPDVELPVTDVQPLDFRQKRQYKENGRITRKIERIRMEHIDKKNSLDSKLQIESICSIRIRSGN